MARVLVVVNPFGGLGKGDRITDPEEIKKVLAGEQAHHVIQSDHSDLDDAEKSS
jgi:hypothetical protein